MGHNYTITYSSAKHLFFEGYFINTPTVFAKWNSLLQNKQQGQASKYQDNFKMEGSDFCNLSYSDRQICKWAKRTLVQKNICHVIVGL